MLTMNGVYERGRIKLNEKYKLNQKCEVLVVFHGNYSPVKKETGQLDDLVNKINNSNIHKTSAPRKDWGKAFQKMRKNGDDTLFFADNKADFEWEW